MSENKILPFSCCVKEAPYNEITDLERPRLIIGSKFKALTLFGILSFKVDEVNGDTAFASNGDLLIDLKMINGNWMASNTLINKKALAKIKFV